MYYPSDDSNILLREVVKYSHGKVLDIGTGTGVQALAAARLGRVKKVLAVDIDPEAIVYCHKNIDNSKIECQVSDLFSNVDGKFDTVVFNPPYLPKDKGINDPALYGGKEGYELIEKFFDNVGNHLKVGGIILLVFSSHTNKEKVDKIIRDRGFKTKLLNKKHIFFEDLYVYLIRRNKEQSMKEIL